MDIITNLVSSVNSEHTVPRINALCLASFTVELNRPLKMMPQYKCVSVFELRSLILNRTEKVTLIVT